MYRVFPGCTAIVLLSLLAGCMSAPDPYALYSQEERRLLEEDDAIRASQHAARAQERAFRETLPPEMLAQRLASGNEAPVEGLITRGDDVFEGQMVVIRNPYTRQRAFTYGRGSYHAVAMEDAQPVYFHGLYRGDFKYFHDNPGPENRRRRGTMVMIGEFTRHDGARDKGIYVAEQAVPGVPLHFVKATPRYLQQIERRYDTQVARFREEQARRAREEESSSGFGPLLALGLGGLILASADIPGADIAQIGAALFQDVMTDGQSRALATIAQRGGSSYAPSRFVGTVRNAQPAGPQSARGHAVGASRGSAAPAPAAGQTEQYSFRCPSGQSATVPIPYQSNSCLAAKKEMTRIYSCNLVGEFSRVAQTCSQACGSPQCTE